MIPFYAVCFLISCLLVLVGSAVAPDMDSRTVFVSDVDGLAAEICEIPVPPRFRQ